MALQPKVDVTRNPMQEYQWPHKITDYLYLYPTIFFFFKIIFQEKLIIIIITKCKDKVDLIIKFSCNVV